MSFWIERLKMSVKAPMANDPNCFRCLYEKPSVPTKQMGAVCFIACFVMLGVEGGGRFLCGRCLRFVLSIFFVGGVVW